MEVTKSQLLHVVENAAEEIKGQKFPYQDVVLGKIAGDRDLFAGAKGETFQEMKDLAAQDHARYNRLYKANLAVGLGGAAFLLATQAIPGVGEALKMAGIAGGIVAAVTAFFGQPLAEVGRGNAATLQQKLSRWEPFLAEAQRPPIDLHTRGFIEGLQACANAAEAQDTKQAV